MHAMCLLLYVQFYTYIHMYSIMCVYTHVYLSLPLHIYIYTHLRALYLTAL